MVTLRRVVATAWVLCAGVLCWDIAGGRTAKADLPDPEERRALPWVAPDWHPAPAALAVLEDLDGPASSRGPRVSARAAFLADLDSGEVLAARGADLRRPVASLTKLVSALAMSSEPVDLHGEHCVDKAFWPSRSGARSRLSTGECYEAWDLLGAAMVSSDNRAAYGLQVASGLEYRQFIARMDEISVALRMDQSTWADPSGLEDENLSTARDMAKAAVAVAAHPVLSVAATAPTWDLARTNTPEVRRLFSTDRLLARKDLEVLAAKTGYTDTAGYSFAGVVRTDSGRRLVVTVLGAPRSHHRWRDVSRLIDWAEGL